MYLCLCLYLYRTIKQNDMTTLINAIQRLEIKQDNGTITMTEEVILCNLIEMVEDKIYQKQNLTIVK